MGSGGKRAEKPAASRVEGSLLLWPGYQARWARTPRVPRLGVSRGGGKDVIRPVLQIWGPVGSTVVYPISPECGENLRASYQRSAAGNG